MTSVRVLEKSGMKYKRKTVFHGVKMDVYQLEFRLKGSARNITAVNYE
jgi:hypothetical protein